MELVWDLVLRIVCCTTGVFFGYYMGKHKYYTQSEVYKAKCKEKEELIAYLSVDKAFKSTQ